MVHFFVYQTFTVHVTFATAAPGTPTTLVIDSPKYACALDGYGKAELCRILSNLSDMLEAVLVI